MRTEMRNGKITNKELYEISPMEKIAKVIDFYFPFYITNLLDMIKDLGIEGIKNKYDVKELREEITQQNYQNHLSELFWAVSKKENVFDLMFFWDYYVYINFFLQFPRISGRELRGGGNCKRILEEYQSVEMRGEVYGIGDDDEYTIVVSETDSMECKIKFDEKHNPSEEGDMLLEIMQIDAIIKNYKEKNILYQAERISEEKGQVILELMDGSVITGVAAGIAGAYTQKGYEIKEMLTFEETDGSGYRLLEEADIKGIMK